MAICKICGAKHNRRSDFCSRICYYKKYYQEHKKEIGERTLEYHKQHYIPHPIKRKTEEEKREYRKKYYQEHREYYRQKSKEHYLRNKDNAKYRKRKSEAKCRYAKKRYANDPEFRAKSREYKRRYLEKKRKKLEEGIWER